MLGDDPLRLVCETEEDLIRMIEFASFYIVIVGFYRFWCFFGGFLLVV